MGVLGRGLLGTVRAGPALPGAGSTRSLAKERTRGYRCGRSPRHSPLDLGEHWKLGKETRLKPGNQTYLASPKKVSFQQLNVQLILPGSRTWSFPARAVGRRVVFTVA